MLAIDSINSLEIQDEKPERLSQREVKNNVLTRMLRTFSSTEPKLLITENTVPVLPPKKQRLSKQLTSDYFFNRPPALNLNELSSEKVA